MHGTRRACVYIFWLCRAAGGVWTRRGLRAALFALALVAAMAFLPRLVRRLKGPRFTEAASLRTRMAGGEKILVIDVRTAQEFSGQLGHIPGAVNIPIAELPDRIQELKNTKVPILAV